MHLGILVARRVRAKPSSERNAAPGERRAPFFTPQFRQRTLSGSKYFRQAPHRLRSGVRLARRAVRLRMCNHDATDAPHSPSANASIEHVRDMSGERVNSVASVRD